TTKEQLTKAIRQATGGGDTSNAGKTISELRQTLYDVMADTTDPGVISDVQKTLGFRGKGKGFTPEGDLQAGRKYTIEDLVDISDARLAGRVQEIQAAFPGITPTGIVRKLNGEGMTEPRSTRPGKR